MAPSADPEVTLLRLTAVSLAVQGLIEVLARRGQIDLVDLRHMRDFGLRLAADFHDQTDSEVQVSGHRIADAVNAFWDNLDAPSAQSPGRERGVKSGR